LTNPPASIVLYLAYGSNLCAATFQGSRSIRPLSAVPVRVPDLTLTFTLPGIPYVEPCFANVVRRGSASKELVGVVYEISRADYEHVIATEGPTYEVFEATCTTLPASTASSSSGAVTFLAHTLLAPPSPFRPSTYAPHPSLRYINLLRLGAAEHALPAAWQTYLAGLPHYEARTRGQRVGRVVFIVLWGPVMLTSLLVRRILPKAGQGAMKWILAKVFGGMWWSYDWVFKPVFGEGERAI
ncbi:hypothetical protein BT63DRAFT_363959, partial [Microthyrium microscopicum]